MKRGVVISNIGALLFLVLFSKEVFGLLKYSTTSYVLLPGVVSGIGGLKVSSGYKMLLSEESVGGSVEVVDKRNLLGFVSCFIKTILGGRLSFYDEYPVSTDKQQTTNVECKVTLESYSGSNVKISSVRYRISNKGSAEENFSSLRDDVSVDTIYNSKKIRFKVSIPNSYNDTFSETSENYIQWYGEDESHNSVWSAKYKIKVLENDVPYISIIQPKNKDIVSTKLVVEAFVEDELWGVDASSISIKIEDETGRVVWYIDSVKYPQIWDSQRSKLYYHLEDPVLEDNKWYSVIIFVSDKKGICGMSSTKFLVRGGKLADVVPYPSPCDVSKQPLTIRYVLPEDSQISMNIYNEKGTLVKSLVEKQNRSAGMQEEKWYGENFANLGVASGIYFCEIIVNNNSGEYRHYVPLAILRKK